MSRRVGMEGLEGKVTGRKKVLRADRRDGKDETKDWR